MTNNDTPAAGKQWCNTCGSQRVVMGEDAIGWTNCPDCRPAAQTQGHTPTPWRQGTPCSADIQGSDGRDVAIAICKQMSGGLEIVPDTVGPASREEAYANAAFIVEAVNAHARLLAERDMYKQAADNAALDRIAMLAANERLVADAARYQWLRKGDPHVFVFNPEAGRIEGDNLDAVVDGGIRGA